jgi:hypothetical protein
LVGHIDLDEAAPEFAGDLVTICLVDIADDDLGSLGGEPLPSGQPDAAGAAGDDGDLSCQTRSHG